MATAANAFLLDVENVRQRVAGTVKLYRIYLEQLKSFCEGQGVIDIGDITPGVCADFAQRIFPSAAANTSKSKIITLRSFFAWTLERYNLPFKNPFKTIRGIKSKPAPRPFWTVEQCEKIIAVQMLMRHENVTLTLNIYGHLLPSDLEQATEL